MTSPAINKSPESQKNQKKSPTHTATEAEPTAGASQTATEASPQAEHFSWLRIFKLADLMMKQGC